MFRKIKGNIKRSPTGPIKKNKNFFKKGKGGGQRPMTG